MRAVGHSLDTEARDSASTTPGPSAACDGWRDAARLLGESWGGGPTTTAAVLGNVEHGQGPNSGGSRAERCRMIRVAVR
ncbi:hypothetical protein [Streptomyces sp. NPDC008092]|uniref:hypothetical protein n=1 Tax=Streptomyces sp. NPDC008092 TaxID=3364808 RepID=UPI0036E5837A